MALKRILFLIHDLGVGGAEKVLINLVNHMDRNKFDITVVSLFGGGVNEQFLAPHVKYRSVWPRIIPGNSKLMKLLTPQQLHRLCVKKHYDIEVAYLEGPSARVISGCEDPETNLFCWIHIEQKTRKGAARAFRSYEESRHCYDSFKRIVCVSKAVKDDFLSIYPKFREKTIVRYNTLETNRILLMKDEAVQDVSFRSDEIKLVAVGKISRNKGFDRLARIVKRLREDRFPIHLYALGIGPDQKEIETYLHENGLEEYFTFLGYQINPYKYVAHCDLFVCASLAEGFSTATAEALIIGTPVCTVEVSGMREMLGSDGEYGIVTHNNENALYQGIRTMVSDRKLLFHYKQKAIERGKLFSIENTVMDVEKLFLDSLIK